MTEPSVHYREINPPPALAAFVRCIWHLHGQSDGSAESIIPDGCAEIVVNVGDAFVRHTSPTSSHTQPARLVAGQITRALTLEATGRMDIWGVRLHPWCASAFTDVAASELRDQTASLDEVARPLDSMLSRVADARSEDAAGQTLIDTLTRHAARIPQPSANVPRLVMFAARASETATVRRISRDAGVSTRRLQTLFRDHVGLSPKQLLRVSRFQRALRIARTQPTLSWSRVAHLAGFYDQAHFIHDSNDIAGCTPSALVRRDAPLTEAFLAKE